MTSWKRLIDPRTAADYYYVMLDVAGAADVAGADPDDDAAVDAALENFGVEAPDDTTFVVHLSHPATYFVSIATLWVTAPLRADLEFGEADTYVSSGPFVLSTLGSRRPAGAGSEPGVDVRAVDRDLAGDAGDS